MTEEELLNQISDCQYQITLLNEEIAATDTQIDDMLTLIKKAENLGAIINETADSCVSSYQNVLSSLAAAGKIISGLIFGNAATVFKGPEYTKSCNSIAEIIRKAAQRAEDLSDDNSERYRQINNLQNQIDTCRIKISQLAAQEEIST